MAVGPAGRRGVPVHPLQSQDLFCSPKKQNLFKILRYIESYAKCMEY